MSVYIYIMSTYVIYSRILYSNVKILNIPKVYYFYFYLEF